MVGGFAAIGGQTPKAEVQQVRAEGPVVPATKPVEPTAPVAVLPPLPTVPATPATPPTPPKVTPELPALPISESKPKEEKTPPAPAPTKPMDVPVQPASGVAPPSGCAFHPRCELAEGSCDEAMPALTAMPVPLRPSRSNAVEVAPVDQDAGGPVPDDHEVACTVVCERELVVG